jgi:hypothetical protein
MTTSIRRIVPYIVSCLLILATATSFVSAQGFTSEKTGVKEAGQAAGYDVAAVANCSGKPGGCIPLIIGNVISALLGIFGAVFLALIMWGGAQWMFAGGDTTKVKNATATIRNAVLGMLVVAASYAIVNFVLTTVGTATSSGVKGV